MPLAWNLTQKFMPAPECMAYCRNEIKTQVINVSVQYLWVAVLAALLSLASRVLAIAYEKSDDEEIRNDFLKYKKFCEELSLWLILGFFVLEIFFKRLA
jgi:hypothetical protein